MESGQVMLTFHAQNGVTNLHMLHHSAHYIYTQISGL